MARAGAAIGPPAKHMRFGQKVAQAASLSAPGLANLARLAARSGGLVRPPPPPRDPQTQPELWQGGGCEGYDDPLFLEFLRACTPQPGLAMSGATLYP